MVEVQPGLLVPPFTAGTAAQKVRLAEDGWNSRDPERVSRAYSAESRWRNRDSMLQGRASIVAFLRRKWERELDYRLVKELWAHSANRIAVRFVYEWHDEQERWFRAYGNENWEFDADGLMRWRQASINDVAIDAEGRWLRWEAPGRRPAEHAGLTELEVAMGAGGQAEGGRSRAEG